MCRFLIVKSAQKLKPEEFLKSFAQVCKKSKAPDGASQNDGYGIAWQSNKSWHLKKSLAPIWTERDLFKKIPKTNLFIAHARSAGFDKDKDNLDYNQPFIDNKLCFVFNGMIRKITLNLPLEGKIGSQKLFSIIKIQNKKNKIDNVLKLVKKLILENAEKVEGMNIGLVSGSNIYVLCQYADNKNYFSLNYYQDKDLVIVSSERFGFYNWKIMEKGEIKIF